MRKSLILGLLSLPLLFAMSCGPKPATKLNVMTFNMRYDNPEDGENNWQYRRERVARVIESNGVDIFGAQELLVNQLNDLKGLLPEYDEVGVGREDGREAGEFNPVFYRRDRTALANGWLPGRCCATRTVASSSSSTPIWTMSAIRPAAKGSRCCSTALRS